MLEGEWNFLNQKSWGTAGDNVKCRRVGRSYNMAIQFCVITCHTIYCTLSEISVKVQVLNSVPVLGLKGSSM